MSDQFPHLFSPLKIGTMTVRNRIVMPSHMKLWEDTTTIENGCLMTERTAYYYAERAKGGAGFLIVGMHAVHPQSVGYGPSGLPEAWRKENIPRYKLLTDMCHEHGAKVGCQLVHCGGQLNQEFEDPRFVWGPSAIWGRTDGTTVAKEMTHEDIKELIEFYCRSAINCREGGYDAIEIHGASGYMVQQFLSPISNKRTDEYGGSLENRMRLTLELIDAMRKAVGKDYTLGIRLGVDELVEGGLTLEETRIAAKTYADTGNIDFINVQQGSLSGQTLPVYAFGPGITMLTVGCFIPYAAAIKMEVQNIPIFCVAKIIDPMMAEKILADGHADMIGMVRALICDPEMPNKARAGRLDDIRYCQSCNQGCRGKVVGSPSCVQNPAAGRERRFGIGTLKSARVKKKVVVVGGGPGGLKAAEIAARRGHDVTLYEKDVELGGQLRLAAKTELLADLSQTIRYLSIQVNRLGVKVNTGVEATPGMLLDQKPDAVVLATGCKPLKTTWDPVQLITRIVPGVEQDNVVSVEDVLEGKVKVGQRVVVADGENHYRSLSVADHLAQQGKQVEIVCYSTSPIAPSYYYQCMASGDRMVVLDRFIDNGVKITANTVIKEISGDTLIVSKIRPTRSKPGVDDKITGVDTIVWAMGRKPNEDLYLALKDKIKELYRVGDCMVPRYMQHAIFEGEMVGRQL